MEKEEKSEKGASQTDLMLQWGNRKRLRCVKLKKGQNSSDSAGKKKITFRVDGSSDKEFSSPHSQCPNNYRSIGLSTSSWKPCVASPGKEDRYYTTRGSMGLDENGKAAVMDNPVEEERGLVWPKLFITLSSKEKEADFLAMKGCKLPQRPKKRAKLIQRSLLLVTPGAWLSDLCKERYKVREKNSSKKRPRGLKAMGSMESDSE